MAYGGLTLLRRGIRGLRTLAAKRRLAGGHAARRPANDPHGRATVAVVRGPGLVRVQLLWVRGDAEDAAYVEVRTLAERQIEEDDAGRAEDAIAALSEIALRADNAHALRRDGGLAALGLGRRRHPSVAERPRVPDAPPEDEPPLEVGPEWEPEPLTDAGQAELSRRLVPGAARALERGGARAAARHARGRRAARPAAVAAQRSAARCATACASRPLGLWTGIVTFVVAMFSGDDAPLSDDAVVIGCAGLAVAVVAALVPRVLAPAQAGPPAGAAPSAPPLARPPRALEQGLPGSAGLVFAVARGDDGSRSCTCGRPPTTAAAASSRCGRSPRAPSTTTLDAAQHVLRDRRRGAAALAERRPLGPLPPHAARPARARAGAIGEPALRREPLAWVAVLLGIGVLVAASVKHFVAGTWFEHGLGSRAISYAWVVLASVHRGAGAARRIRDPFAL